MVTASAIASSFVEPTPSTEAAALERSLASIDQAVQEALAAMEDAVREAERPQAAGRIRSLVVLATHPNVMHSPLLRSVVGRRFRA